MTPARVAAAAFCVAAGLGVLGVLLRADGRGVATAAVDAPASREATAELAHVADGRGFRELVASLRARGAELDRREAELRTRERGLAAVQQAAGAEIARLEAVATSLGIAARPGEGLSIARVYESMDAADVAPLVARLDDATAAIVLGRMRAKQVGAILAALPPERAVALTKALAARTAPPS